MLSASLQRALGASVKIENHHTLKANTQIKQKERTGLPPDKNHSPKWNFFHAFNGKAHHLKIILKALARESLKDDVVGLY